mgnify:CR=1 FL=1
MEQFGTCGDIFNSAVKRSNELIGILYNLDKGLLNILHSIEIEKPKDLYTGWQLYKAIRENRTQRRETKDEIQIIQNVLTNINPECVQRERIQKPWMDFSIENIHIELSKETKMMRVKQKYITIR